MIYFISGHRDTNDTHFNKYATEINRILDIAAVNGELTEFIVGDYYGVDDRAQQYLKQMIDDRKQDIKVTVYHMFTEPRHNAGFPTKGGFTTDHERDLAMTMASDNDIAFVMPGKEGSGTAQNLVRRKIVQLFNYMSKKERGKFIESISDAML